MYLQMDGVDDNLISPTLTFDTLEMDCMISSTQVDSGRYVFDARSGMPNSHMQYDYDGDNLFWDEMYVNGILQPSANPIYFVIGNRMTFKLIDINGGGTENIHLFSSYINHAELAGAIYSVKLYLGTNLVAHYDMSTGTVQDQSGNGNHATLTGGTWVADTPTGNAITSDYSTEQLIYDNISSIFRTKQSVYKNELANFDTEQIIYKTITELYDTLQEITDSGITRTTMYDFNLQIFNDTQTVFSTKQAYYKDFSTQLDLQQAIYETAQREGDIHIVIHADQLNEFSTLQHIYQQQINHYELKQTIYDPDTSLVSTIRLKGNRNLHVYLKANRNLNTQIKCSRNLHIKMKGRIT